MRKIWNNANPKKFGYAFIPMKKLAWIMWVLNYAKSSETHSYMKCDCAVYVSVQTEHL